MHMKDLKLLGCVSANSFKGSAHTVALFAVKVKEIGH